MPRKTFGERVKWLRTQRKLTTSQLAMMVGVTEGAIRQIESGQTKKASFDVGLRLADALHISPWDLAGDEGHRPDLIISTDRGKIMLEVQAVTTTHNAQTAVDLEREVASAVSVLGVVEKPQRRRSAEEIQAFRALFGAADEPDETATPPAADAETGSQPPNSPDPTAYDAIAKLFESQKQILELLARHLPGVETDPLLLRLREQGPGAA